MIKKYAKRWFIDAMSAMALGLFSSLIIGLILSQLARIPALSFLANYADIVSAQSPVVGAAIGVAVSWGLKSSPLTIFSSAAAGAFGYQVGGPVGAYIGSLAGSEIARIVAGRTKVDIILTPIFTIIPGCAAAQFTGPYIQKLMLGLGQTINSATELSPLPMGIIVAVIVGMALTAPISSAALCIMLDLNGLAAGAAAAGCCAQMIGFAVMSYKENKLGGLISQGLGTSMLQFANILRKPAIWIPPTLASALCGALSTVLFKMTNIASGAGMGTSGLVGQFGAITAMQDTFSMPIILAYIAILHFIIPAVATLAIAEGMRKLKWIKPADLKIQVQ
jgi:uncharacterized membrane protein